MQKLSFGRDNPAVSDNTFLIRDLAIDEQPREKLLHRGPRSLSDADLIAILLRTGVRGRSAIDLARRILSSVDYNLHRMARLEVGDLTRIEGVGTVKAMQIVAALELGRRREAAPEDEHLNFSSSADCYRYLRPLIADLDHEELHLLCLNQASRLLGAHLVSRGGTTATVADAKPLFRTALRHGSVTSIVIAHNHPSGRHEPSEADIVLTDKLRRAATSLDIRLADHLIVTANGYYSFAEACGW